MQNSTKLNNIQVLRAFAALVVVVFHTGYVFPHMRPFGSFGVDVFFVISGYIMARILDPRSDSNGEFFFRRRVIRIVPPYWFFTILLFVAAFVIPGMMGSTRASWVDLFKSLFFIPFAKYSGVIQPLLFIGWSLNYEMFFYVALALGILVHTRLRSSQLVKRLDAVWIGGALVLLAMAICRLFAQRSVPADFYSRELVLEFLLGILSYYCCRSISNIAARRYRALSLLVCVLSAAGLIGIQGVFGLTGLRVVVFGIASFFLVSSASLLSQGGWDVEVAWLVLIGDASYILYLTHTFCEYSMDRIFSSHAHWLKRDTPSGAVMGVAFSVAVAVIVHLFGERPTVRFLNRRFGGRRKAIEFSTPAV